MSPDVFQNRLRAQRSGKTHRLGLAVDKMRRASSRNPGRDSQLWHAPPVTFTWAKHDQRPAGAPFTRARAEGPPKKMQLGLPQVWKSILKSVLTAGPLAVS